MVAWAIDESVGVWTLELSLEETTDAIVKANKIGRISGFLDRNPADRAREKDHTRLRRRPRRL